MGYSTLYSQPSAPAYYEYNSYHNSYPTNGNMDVMYGNTDRFASYPFTYRNDYGVPSVTVNAGGPFLGQAQSRNAQTTSDLHSVVTEANPTNTQKREADLTQLKDAVQNEMMQQQMEKSRIIKEASAGTITIGGTK